MKSDTRSGTEFTDRLFTSRKREPSSNHEFDQLCQETGIEHRLTKLRTPRTNGMVEQFNSREDMKKTLLRNVALNNHQSPQSVLGRKTPMRATKNRYQEHPNLFHKRPYDRPGYEKTITKYTRKIMYQCIFQKKIL